MASTSSGSLSIQEFNSKEVLKELTEAFSRGDLKTSLYSHWCKYVPVVYAVPCQDVAVEERRAYKLLFKPLEVLLCASDDPDSVFQHLTEQSEAPQLCGKVFKKGEPTYSCRDCGVDPTCVLCNKCFEKSSHKNHRYKMSTSGGGGYCDCGDVEAWKTDPFCELHKKLDDSQEQSRDPLESLPEEMRSRADAILRAVTYYCVTMLTWSHSDTLPEGLDLPEESDVYCTMLFNDEVHTYDQVISTLQLAVDASQKEAVEFATVVDREGRSAVLDGEFARCEKAREEIERSTSRRASKPLKCQVMRTPVVSHQAFALKLFPWIQKIMNFSEGFRRLFCLIAMESCVGDGLSLLERMLLADTRLWKAARIQSHQLFMSGVLMDLECKKKFAELFTKRYPKLMRAFIEDDHDHDVCVVSTTVQIYTVISLARMLIAEHDLLSVILRTFVQECQSKINDKGTFTFQRIDRSQAFKRAQYILYDVKYALTCKPSPGEWTDPLRVNFMEGFNVLLDLLKYMQGMDSVTRQTGQHLEFEPEWEGAFNLQLKLEDIIAMILEWCATDRMVLIEAYKSTLKAIHAKNLGVDQAQTVLCKLASHEAECISYEVQSETVSIHLQVSRLLAGLHLLLHDHNLTFGPEIFPEDLTPDPVRLIELPLRTLVMVAQSHAGMWKRNGYSLLNQIYCYHDVRCREEMYNKDIILMQVAASIIDNNKFLIHLLNKFGLMSWVRVEYDIPPTGPQEDMVRQTIIVAEEFLNLLLVILSERYVPGIGKVTKNDKIKREIIHQLCISSMSHSELAKTLHEDANHETGLEENVHTVANFKKRSDTGKGFFELKPEFYGSYNPFFYHYTKAEQSKSEESQRKRRKLAGEDQALPPPTPPELTSPFTSMTGVLYSDIMLYIMELVLQRTLARRSRSWSEVQFEKILHLIGLALHEEKRAHENDTEFSFTNRAGEVFRLLESLVGHPNVNHEAQKDLLTWVIRTFNDVKRMKGHVHKTAEEMEVTPNPDDDKREKEKKHKQQMASRRRAQLLAKMSAMQRNFIKENAELFEGPSTGAEMQSSVSDMDVSQSETSDSQVAIGTKRSASSIFGSRKVTCILCQDEEVISHQGRAMLLTGLVQRSTVLSQTRGREGVKPDRPDPTFMSSDLSCGPYTSTCGHVMHSDCWQRYFDSILAKERRRSSRLRQILSYNIDNSEFLCPLCETLSNTVIPLLPPLSSLTSQSEPAVLSELNVCDWFDAMQKTVMNSISQTDDEKAEEESGYIPFSLGQLSGLLAGTVAQNFQALFDYYGSGETHAEKFSVSISEMLKKFASDSYRFGLDVHPDEFNPRVPIMAWKTTAFTLQVIEQSLRDESKPLFGALPSRQEDCISAIVRLAAVMGQAFPSTLIRKHCLSVLTGIFADVDTKKEHGFPNILEFDAFHSLVTLACSVPCLYVETDNAPLSLLPLGHLNDQHLLLLTFTLHLTQILLTTELTTEDCMETESDEDGAKLLEIYKTLRQKVGLETLQEYPTTHQLISHVKTSCLPFLRCAAMFYHHITGVAPSACLSEVGDHFEALCNYLSLPPSLSELFEEFEKTGLYPETYTRWCCEDVRKLVGNHGNHLPSYPLEVNQLVSLPRDYSELINRVSCFTCPSSDGDDSRAPTMCLVCGEVLCSQSYCCQTELNGMIVGAATAHAHKCGSDVGLFLRVRECQILLLAGKTKGCFYAPPYLDDYGETDQGLRRGNPLRLCPVRLKKLHKLWFSHGIPEEIAHCLESKSNLLQIDWHLL